MTTAPERTLRGAPAGTVEGPTTFPDDQLYMLKLCLELQLDALLLTLGSSAAMSRESGLDRRGAGGTLPTGPHEETLPWEKWLTEDLELATALTRDCLHDGVPLPSALALVGAASGRVVESLAARYSAMAAVVGEMLERTDEREHSAAVGRLVETRHRCEERLDALLGESLETAAERFFPPAAVPGHYLG
jgi:hypothetical protein